MRPTIPEKGLAVLDELRAQRAAIDAVEPPLHVTALTTQLWWVSLEADRVVIHEVRLSSWSSVTMALEEGRIAAACARPEVDAVAAVEVARLAPSVGWKVRLLGVASVSDALWVAAVQELVELLHVDAEHAVFCDEVPGPMPIRRRS